MTLAEHLREEGLQKGLQKGLQQGIQEGIQQGRQEGIQQGRQEGIQEGIAEEHTRMISKMILANVDFDLIAQISDLTRDEIEKLAQSLQDKQINGQVSV